MGDELPARDWAHAMIVAITGGTGFIGRKLVAQQLALGREVRVLTRREAATAELPAAVRIHRGDLTGAADLPRFLADVDVLFHCAAELTDTGRMEAVHVTGTGALIAAAAGRIGRWVQLSSGGAYGQRADGVVTEGTEVHPGNRYEESKVESDRLVAAAADRAEFEHVILRPTNVYGARMANRSLYALIAMIDQGRFFFVGGRGASANYIHVDNVVEALELCGTVPGARGRVYNLSDRRSLEQFVDCISLALGRRKGPHLRLPEMPVRLLTGVLTRAWRGCPLTRSRVDALTTRVSYPITRISTELGYRHPVTMEQGLLELVAFWQSGQTWRSA